MTALHVSYGRESGHKRPPTRTCCDKSLRSAVELLLGLVGGTALDVGCGPLLRIVSGKGRRTADEMLPGSKRARASQYWWVSRSE